MQKQLQLLIDLLPEVTVIGKTDKIVTDVTADSRTVQKGSLFIALKGERFDAHDFVADVVERGCPLAVVNRLVQDVPEDRQLVVDDTLKAYGKIGFYNRSRYNRQQVRDRFSLRIVLS